jgi:CRISPR-associated protein Cmr4
MTQSASASSSDTGVAVLQEYVTIMSLYAETPVHSGTGQTTGIIDLPIQRERHTGFPVIPATGLKGSLRQVGEQKPGWGRGSNQVTVLFGPDSRQGGQQGENLHAGAIAITDARLLAFPVRSLSNVFMWVTCPFVLGRLARDMKMAGMSFDQPSLNPLEQNAIVASPVDTMVLEDLSFQSSQSDEWANVVSRIVRFLPDGAAHHTARDKFTRHLALISDSDFEHLVKNATQITARIHLNENKTTTGGEGNLWYEESLPPDVLFYSLVRLEQPRAGNNGSIPDASRVRETFLELVSGDPFFLQVGGNETVGFGWCSVKIIENREDSQ